MSTELKQKLKEEGARRYQASLLEQRRLRKEEAKSRFKQKRLRDAEQLKTVSHRQIKF